MFGDIDLKLKPDKPQLFICKPNKQIIGNLDDAFNIVHKLKLTSLNELTFSLYYNIDINNELVKNPNIDKIKNRYLIKFVKGNYIEWFLINKPINNMNDNEDVKNVNCFSLGYELASRNIRGYKVTSYTPTQVLTDALLDTPWNIKAGGIDAELNLMKRSFDISTSKVLDFIYQIAETFNGLIEWDTVNREISLVKYDDIGNDINNIGLYLSYGKYLKTLEQEINSDEMCTRLKVVGKDGVSIQRHNISGTNYIEDFSYFMYPFTKEDGVITRHSEYMSDELCEAILNYNAKLLTKQSEFDAYLDALEGYEEELTTLNNQLTDKTDDLNAILDSIDVVLATGLEYKNTTPYSINSKVLYYGVPYNCIQDSLGHLPTEIAYWEDMNDTKDSIQSEIDAINLQITNDENTGIQDLIDATNASIATLRDEIDIENPDNFTSELLLERSQFIIEKIYENQYCDSAEDLYNLAFDYFENIKEPQLSIKIDLINFLEIVEYQQDWGKINLGDNIRIMYELMGIDVIAKIIEAEFEFENSNINLTIANVKEVMTDDKKFWKSLQNSIGSSNVVDVNKYLWNSTGDNTSEIGRIIDILQGNIKNEIEMSGNENVSFGRRGLLITDPTDPNAILIIQNGVLAISNNKGVSWDHAITKYGIVGEKIFGRILAGQNLQIDASTVEGTSIFTVDETGVTIKGGALTITDGLPDSQIANANVWNTLKSDYDTFVGVTYPQEIQSIHNQLDGNVTTWFKDYEPTLLNLPASDWTTNEIKNDHLGDLFYNNSTGLAYRFTYIDPNYSWVQITDTIATQALAIANLAKDTADGKRRVFMEQPNPATSDGYDAGDLWRKENEVDLYVCINSKTSTQLFDPLDWIPATNAQTYITIAQNTANLAISVMSNPYFEKDKSFWSEEYIGETVPETTVGTILTSIGNAGGKVLQIEGTSGAVTLYYKNAIPINRNNVYKLKFIAREIGAGVPNLGYYFAYCLDNNYQPIGSFGAQFSFSDIDDWQTKEYIVSGSSIPESTAYIRPGFIVNFFDYPDSITQIDMLEFADITEAYAAQVVANNSVQKETAYNGVKIDNANGLVITKTGDLVRSIFNATYGLKIQSRSSISQDWDDPLTTDIYNKVSFDAIGNLNLKGNLLVSDTFGVNATNGIWVGNATPSSAKFRVTPTGNVTITGDADIKGKIRCTELYIGNDNILDTIDDKIDGKYLSDNSIDDSKISDLSVDKLTAGTIDASVINIIKLNASNITTGALSASRISGGEFTATNYIQIGNKDNANKNLYMYTSSGYNVVFSASGGSYPYLTISADQIDLYTSDTWIRDSNGNKSRIVCSNENQKIKFQEYNGGLEYSVNGGTMKSISGVAVFG